MRWRPEASYKLRQLKTVQERMSTPPLEHRRIIEQIIERLPTTAETYTCRAWTKALKLLMRKLCEEHLGKEGWEFCGSLVEKDRTWREWLVDVAWYRTTTDEECILLALESEWAQSLDEIGSDFCKLLATKAPLKIFLFESQKHAIGRLQQIVNKWQQHTPGDVIYALDFSHAQHKTWICTVDSDPARKPAFTQIEALCGPDNSKSV
jgi:hypothetical protein